MSKIPIEILVDYIPKLLTNLDKVNHGQKIIENIRKYESNQSNNI